VDGHHEGSPSTSASRPAALITFSSEAGLDHLCERIQKLLATPRQKLPDLGDEEGQSLSRWMNNSSPAGQPLGCVILPVFLASVLLKQIQICMLVNGTRQKSLMGRSFR
jgi:hypothetical protein